MKIFTTTVFALMSLWSVSQNLNPQFANSFGSISSSNEVVWDMVTDANNDIIAVGKHAGVQLPFEGGAGNITTAGGDDAFVAKLSGTNGGVLWFKTFGGDGDDSALHVDIDSQGNIFIAGLVQGLSSLPDMNPGTAANYMGSYNSSKQHFLLKLDNNGNYVSAKVFMDSGNVNLAGMEVNSNNDIIMVGHYNSTIYFDNNPDISPNASTNTGNDIFISRYDNNLNLNNYVTTVGSADDSVFAIALDSQDNIYFTGYSESWDFTIGGSTQGEMSTEYLVKLNPFCQLIDVLTMPYVPGVYASGKAIAFTTDGQVVWGLNVNGPSGLAGSGIQLRFLDPQTLAQNSTHFTQNTFGSMNLRSLVPDAAGNVFVYADFNGMHSVPLNMDNGTLISSNGNDPIIYKVNGEVLNGEYNSASSVQPITGNSIHYASRMIKDNSDNLWITGIFDGSEIDFGNSTILQSSGTYDVFVCRYSSCVAPQILSDSNLQVCEGGSVMLEANSNSPIGWYASATGDDLMYSGNSVTIDNITSSMELYARNECDGASMVTIELITTSPSDIEVLGNYPHCYGTSIELAINFNTDIYTMYGWNGEMSNSNGYVGIFDQSTTIYFNASNPMTNCTIEIPIEITVLPVASSGLLVSNENITANQEANGMITFTWFDCNSNTFVFSSSETNIFTPTYTGSFFCNMSWSNETGCNTTTECYEFIYGATTEITALVFDVYPNPSAGISNVRSAENGLVTVYNILGEKVLETKITSNSNLTLSEMATGTYLIQFQNEKGLTSAQKLIIQ